MRRFHSTLLLLILGIAGCVAYSSETSEKESSSDRTVDNSQLANWVGVPVTVQFRRDALGASHTNPIGPNIDSHNGGKTSQSGKLLEVSPTSLVIKHGNELAWIPQEVILTVERVAPRETNDHRTSEATGSHEHAQ